MDRVRRFWVGSLLCLWLAGMAACGSYSAPATPANSNPNAVVTLSSLTISPASINGGQSTTATLTLNTPAPSGGIQVALAASSDSVILPVIQTIQGPVNIFTVPQNAMSATFPIQTIPVGSNQTVQVTATYLSTVVVQATLTLISTHPLSVTAFTVNASTVLSGETVVGTVTLNAPAFSPGQQVFVASSDPSAQPENPVTVQTNTTTEGFSIFTSPVTAQRLLTITVTLNTSSLFVHLTLQPAGTAITSLVVVPATAAGGTNLTGMVTVSPPAPAGGATVALLAAFTNPATAPNTPLPVTVPASVTVPAGATQAQFTIGSSKVTATTDITLTATLNSSGNTFVLELVSSLSLAGISCANSAVTVGNTIVCNVSLSIAAPAGGQTVMLTSSNPMVLAVPGSTMIPAGSPTSPPLSLVAGVVNTPTPITLTATLAGATTGSVTNVVTLVPVIALNLTSFTLSASVVQGGAMPGGSLTGSFSIAPAGAPPGGLAVNVSSSDPSVQFPDGATVTVPQNATTATFPITATTVTSTVKVTITLDVNAFPLKAMLTVVPPAQVVSVTLSPTSVAGGNSVVGTLTLSVPAPQAGTTVMLQSNSPLAQPAASITVTQGNTAGVFAVTTLPVTTTQMATITATLGASSQQAMLTITPVPPDLRLLFFNPATVPTGRTSTGTVVLTLPAPAGGLSVSLASTSTAVTVPASVTVPAGATTATFVARAMSGVTTATNVSVNALVSATAIGLLNVIPVATGTVTEQIVAGGETNATDFKIVPSAGAFQSSLGAGDDTGFLTDIGLSTQLNGSTTPSYTFSTYLGGMSSFGQVRDVFVDSSGNVFGCGVTRDAHLPTTMNAAQPTFGGGKDAFIAEFNSSGTIQYLSYLGGSGDETCNSLTVDSSGNIYVSGSETDSTAMGAMNLHGTTGAFQTANAGGSDMLVAKINPMGANTAGRLLWLTFVGGAGDDFGDGRIALSPAGSLVITGTSHSTAPPPGGFPIPATQGRPPLNGVNSFGVVVQISADGTTLVGSTLLFGHNDGPSPGTPTTTTASGGIGFDSQNNIYICGQTDASDLPVSANALQPALLGQQDAYIAVLSQTGVITGLTYLGGTSASTVQACKGIAVDVEMNPVILVPTDASDYPVTTGPALSGPTDLAVTKLTHDLSAIVFSRLVGGSGTESADATRLQLDAAENFYFSLATNSPDFPVTLDALQNTFAGVTGGANTNVATVKLSSDGSTILYGSYLGGSTGTNSSTSIFYHLN